MRVRLNEFGRQWELVRNDALSALEKVGGSGWYVLGREVEAFEAELAAYFGVSAAVGVGNGLDALEIALRCLGVGAGDRVLTTPLSAFATSLAIVRAGAVPVFCDVDECGLIDLEQCRSVLREVGGLKGFLPVHLYGQALDLDGLASLQSEFELSMVEDCAQSIGATWRGRPAGATAAVSATSFYPTKNLGALGDGGAVLATTPPLAEQARMLRNYGQSSVYSHDRVGLNSRLDELHAAVLRMALLPRLDELTARRRAVAGRYLAEIRHPLLQLPRTAEFSQSVWHLFVLRVAPGRRRAFMRYLDERGYRPRSTTPVSSPSSRPCGK